MSHQILSVALGACLALTACGGGARQETPPPPAETLAPATTAPAPMAGMSEFGVPECDDYIAKYMACIDSKVPEAQRATMRQSLDQTKAQWRQAAAAPGGKEGLAAGCKAATESAKTAMTAYGCQF